MTPLRKFFYSLACIAAVLALWQLPYAFAISSVLGNPDNIDTALEQGGAYEKFTPAVIEEVGKSATDKNAKQIASDQGFKDAITSSVKASDVQSASQSIIAGVYGWLEGKTPKPEFTIDLSKPISDANTKLAAYAEQRSAGLPACTVQQLQTVNFKDDLLSIPCLPPGVSPAQIGQQFSEQSKQQVELLNDPVITSQQIFEQNNGNQVQFENNRAPQVYQNMHKNKWYTLAIATLLVGLLIFARRNRWAGLRVVGIILLITAGLLTAALLFYVWGKATFSSHEITTQIMVNTILNLVGQVAAIVRWFILGYVVIGAAALIAAKKQASSTTTSQPVIDSTTTV